MSGNHNKAELHGLQKYVHPLLWGLGAGCAACVALLLLLSAVISVRDIPHIAFDPLMVVAGALGAFAAGYLSARLSGERGMLMGLCSSFALFLLLVLCNLLITTCGFGTILLVKLFAMLLAGAVGGILGVNRRVRPR